MTEEQRTIDASMAAERAAAYLTAMMPQAEGILLEEVEKVTDKSKTHWLITLSFQVNLSGVPSSTLRGLSFAMGKREYKAFMIDATTGEVLSMKIRAV
jgi:hypothetical protein